MPKFDDVRDLQIQLHLFPFTHYLVGHHDRLIRFFLVLVVVITLLLIPFITLLALQIRFLVYQSEVITWAQRIAIWLDVIVLSLWPLIMNQGNSWFSYRRPLLSRVQRLLSVRSIVVLFIIFLPLLLTIDGEYLGILGRYGKQLPSSMRHIELKYRTLLGKPISAEALAELLNSALRPTVPPQLFQVVDLIEPVNLKERNLRGATLLRAVMPKAYLRGVQLQCANLKGAVLVHANLIKAQLQNANLMKAKLQGADLRCANLTKANLSGAYLTGADLRGAIGINLNEVADYKSAKQGETKDCKAKLLEDLICDISAEE